MFLTWEVFFPVFRFFYKWIKRDIIGNKVFYNAHLSSTLKQLELAVYDKLLIRDEKLNTQKKLRI